MTKKTQLTDLPEIILASSSPFRQAQLKTLQLPFKTHSPNVDERVLEGESVIEMVKRLSLLKAQTVAEQYPNAIIIASDQSAEFEGQAIGKPHTLSNATKQLAQFSGQKVQFHTGLAVISPKQPEPLLYLETTDVHFRTLNAGKIKRYLEMEQPLNCAGSFKSEGLGVTLFERIDSRDANSLIGLPLMGLTDLMLELGYELPLMDSA